MTEIQKIVLRYMDRHNFGAVLFEGKYRFKQAFREDIQLAVRFYNYCHVGMEQMIREEAA